MRLVVLLHGLGSTTGLIYLWSELHLPPGGSYVGRPSFLDREGFWLVSQNQSDIVKARLSLETGPAVRPEKAGVFADFLRRGRPS